MPRVKDIPGPYRFFFYSFDCREPKHIHVRREWMVCKFWLTPYIEDYLPRLLEAWDEHCGS